MQNIIENRSYIAYWDRKCVDRLEGKGGCPVYRKYKRKGWLSGGIAVMLLILFGVLFIEIRDTSLARQNPLLLSADFLQNALDGVGEVLSNTQEELSSEALPSETAKEVQEEPGPSVTPEEAAWLDEHIASLGGGVSVYYKSLARGDTYSFDDETEYYIASVVKAPYALYVYQLADAGTVDLSQTYTYESRHRLGGTGYLQEQPVGTQYTLAQLLEYTIRYSDNNAFLMVREAVPTDGFKQFVRTLGLLHENSMDSLGEGAAIRGNICAHDAGIIAEAIYRYAESGSPNGAKLKEDMLHTEQPMLRSEYPMARKLGSWEGAMHDVAIIYAPEPYILAVCTNRGHSYDSWYVESDYEPFLKISEWIEEVSQNEES